VLSGNRRKKSHNSAENIHLGKENMRGGEGNELPILFEKKKGPLPELQREARPRSLQEEKK